LLAFSIPQLCNAKKTATTTLQRVFCWFRADSLSITENPLDRARRCNFEALPAVPAVRGVEPSVVSIGLQPILESYWWKTLVNSADIKACLAFAADHEKTDPPWLLSTSGFFFYPYLLKPEILT
jgi:hypothetical protein